MKTPSLRVQLSNLFNKIFIPDDQLDPKRRVRRLMWMCFFVPFGMMALIYMAIGVFPFRGPNSVLVLDMNGQYIYFFHHLRNIMTGNGSLIYSWSRAGGGEFMGIYAYYLASPLSWLVVLFPANNITDAIWLILLLKAGIAGTTMGYYLHKIHPGKTFNIVIFATLYALCAFTLKYMHNIMWMDALMLLPLLALGIERLLSNRKYLLFTTTLALILLSNYYIGFMVCIFVALYFLYYHMSRGRVEGTISETERFHFARSGIRIAIFSAIAVAMAAVILLPAHYSLQFGKMTFTDPSYDLDVSLSLVDILSKMFFGHTDTVRRHGMPFIYAGILPLITVPVFFAAKEAKTREKLAAVFFLGVFILSFSVSLIDIMWHGGQEPNWLNFRYSFMFSFLIVLFGYRGFNAIRDVSRQFLVAVGGILGVLVVLIQLQDYGARHDYTSEYFERFPWLTFDYNFFLVFASLGFIAVLIAMLYNYCAARDELDLAVSSGRVDPAPTEDMSELDSLDEDFAEGANCVRPSTPDGAHEETHSTEIPLPGGVDGVAGRGGIRKKRGPRFAIAILAAVVLFEVFSAGVLHKTTLAMDVGFSSRASYVDFLRRNQRSVDWIHAQDGFFRSEKTFNRMVNDNMALNLRGVSGSTSTLNAYTLDFLGLMGYRATGFRSNYFGGNPVSDSLMGIRYIIDDSNRLSAAFNEIAFHDQINGRYVMRNPHALEIGWAAHADVLNVDHTAYITPFEFLNSLMTAMVGSSERLEIFRPVPILDTQTVNANRSSASGHTTFGVSANGEPAFVNFTVNPGCDDMIFMYIPTRWARTARIFVNGERTGRSAMTSDINHIVEIARSGGAEMEIGLSWDNDRIFLDQAGERNIFYALNYDLFVETIEQLAANQLQIGRFSESRLNGTVTTTADRSVLFTTIPFSPGWRMYVNGVRTTPHMFYLTEEVTTTNPWTGEQTTEYVTRQAALLDAVMAVELPAGTHEIRFVYMPDALVNGMLISSAGLFVFAAVIVTDKVLLPKWKKRKEAGNEE